MKFLFLILPALFLLLSMAGCATTSEITSLRDLPGMKSAAINEFYYDLSILAYREKKKAGDSSSGKALRDAMGKKIRTETELARITTAQKREILGSGTKATGISLLVLYAPVGIPLGIVEGVLASPGLPYFYHVAKTYEQETEKGYANGRKLFSENKAEAALAEWEHTRIITPSLQAYSDIDYWRGRAFQAVGDTWNAQTAYMNFLNYSESSTPEFYKGKYPDEQSWEEKARFVQQQLATLREKTL